MAIERTLGIIKPNAINDNVIGKIIGHYEDAGFKVAAMKMTHLTKEKAEGFYIEHKERPFFGGLVNFMTSAPCILMVIEGDNAVLRNREIMGDTNPADADEGTIRKLFAKSMQANAIHGSDSQTSAEREIAFFFEKGEIFSRF